MIHHPHQDTFGRRSLRDEIATFWNRCLTSIGHFVERGMRANEVGQDDVLYSGF